MKKIALKQLILGAALATSSIIAYAQVTMIADRVSFNALGTIAYNSNFSDFSNSFDFPGDPFTRGDVTYISENNLTVGQNSGYSIGESQTVMSNNYWSPMTATIASTIPYNLFGFDAAVTSGPVDITISTNQNTYHFNELTLPDGSPTFAFEGFQAKGNGEYFTGFRIDTLGGGYLPGITNVAVGAAVSAVPEPETYAMLLAGLCLMGFMTRRKSEKKEA
jgi:hypothetical protein